MAITHHGINHAGTGALTCHLLEAVVEILIEAAAIGDKDKDDGHGTFDINMLRDVIIDHHLAAAET
ncbi:hypothetical protein EDC04DRAFT_2898875 [Pisolithus marmoratus]|nr:hypothetical protein EDC04DRAFT_2898875 [Pisolithus marmoratus]